MQSYPLFSLGTTSPSLGRSSLHLRASLTGTMAVPPDRTSGMISLSMTEDGDDRDSSWDSMEFRTIEIWDS